MTTKRCSIPARLILALMLGLLVLPAFAQDDIAALKMSATQGAVDAQFNLGIMYFDGQDVPQDYREAVRWFRLAADQGYAAAQFHLGIMYRHGEGVPQDYREAVRWYLLAAEQGNSDAQNNLGLMYENGEGVPQNYVRAHMWQNLSASASVGEDREMAVRNRDRVANEMTPEDIAEAQRLAREWKPKGSGSQ